MQNIVEKGFHSEVFDSQKVFRHLLNAMANPGIIMDIDVDLFCPGNLHHASGAISLALLDFETPLWSDLENESKEIQWIKFHTGAPYTYTKKTALFALCTDFKNLEEPQTFNQGNDESPHHSSTLIIETKKIDRKKKIRLTGPGIKTEIFIELKGIKDSFLTQRSLLHKNYPLGVDMIFVWGSSFVAIPRTSKLEVL